MTRGTSGLHSRDAWCHSSLITSAWAAGDPHHV